MNSRDADSYITSARTLGLHIAPEQTQEDFVVQSKHMIHDLQALFE